MEVKAIARVELTAERVLRLLERAKAVLEQEDYRDLENLVKSFAYLTKLLEDKRTTVRHLRKLLFGFKSEKLRKVLEKLNEVPEGQETARSEETNASGGGEVAPAPQDALGAAPAEGGEKDGQGAGEAKKKRKGHGRRGADAYQGAAKIWVGHETLKSGDPCPEPGCNGKVYQLAEPGVLVRIVGQAPLGATVLELEKLRCNLCLTVFTAKVPEGVGPEKYDETAGSMIGLLRYGTGVPFNRLQGLERNLGIPLSASTQWDIVERVSKRIAPAYGELMREAAQGDVLYNDDTPMKILELMKKKGKGDDG
jgi:transposase